MIKNKYVTHKQTTTTELQAPKGRHQKIDVG